MDNKEEYSLNFLKDQYAKNNHFYNYLGIKLEKAYRGHAVQTMEVVFGKHTNLYGYIHGGAIMSIGDTCMGIACASLGKKVVTVDTNINFIKNVKAPAIVKAEAQVVHNGRKTIVMGAKLYNAQGEVLSAMRATFYVIGVFEELLQLQSD